MNNFIGAIRKNERLLALFVIFLLLSSIYYLQLQMAYLDQMAFARPGVAPMEVAKVPGAKGLYVAMLELSKIQPGQEFLKLPVSAKITGYKIMDSKETARAYFDSKKAGVAKVGSAQLFAGLSEMFVAPAEDLILGFGQTLAGLAKDGKFPAKEKLVDISGQIKEASSPQAITPPGSVFKVPLEQADPLAGKTLIIEFAY